MLKRLFITLLFISLSYSQDWHYPGNEICITGQNSIVLKNVQIINKGFNDWNKHTVIQIALEPEFKATFNIENVFVTRGSKKRLSKVSIKTDEQRHAILISNLPRVKPGGIITVVNIALQDFLGFSPPTPLLVSVNDVPGRYISNLEKYSAWVKNTESDTPLSSVVQSLRDALFMVMDANYYKLLFNKYDLNGYFSIVDLEANLETSYTYLSGTQNNILPFIEIKAVKGKNYLKKGRRILIQLPKDVKNTSDNIHILPVNKVKGNFLKGNTLAITLLKKIKKDESIIVSGLEFTIPHEFGPEPIDFKFKIFPDKTQRTVRAKETIGSGDLRFELIQDVQLIANADLVLVPNISLTVRSELSPLNVGDNITLMIPDSINAYWELNQEKFKVTGNGAQSISQEPVVDNSKKTLRFTVRKALPPRAQLIFKGMEMYAVNRSNEVSTAKSLRSPIACVISGDYQQNMLVSTKEIKIVEVKMYQKASSALLVGDSYQELDPVTIEINCDYPAFSRSDQLRITIPRSMSMNWHLSMNQIQLSGPSAYKLGGKVRFDNDFPKSVFIPLNNSFNGKESFTISGLLVTDIEKASRGNLQLFLNRDENELTRQEYEIVTQSPKFSTLEDQILFNNDQSTNLFSVNINVKQLRHYFEEGDRFSIRIPANSPVTFDRHVKGITVNDNRISSAVSYPNRKEAQFIIDKDLPDNLNIKISGLKYDEPGGLTITPDTLMLYILDGNEKIGPLFCENVYEIVSKKSEFKQAQYYYTLIKSNFYNKDTVKLKLSSPLAVNMNWDIAKIKNNFELVIPPQGGKISGPLFLNDTTIGFVVDKTLNPEDIFRIRGLYIKKPYTDRYCYLKLEYDNFYGDHQIIMNQPIEYNMEGKLGHYPTPPLFITESYTEPLMFYVNEEGKRIKSNDKVRYYLKKAFDSDYTLPDLQIENGKLTALNKKVYNDYRSNLKYLNHSLDVKDYSTAIEIGRKLIKISPNYWKGYYKLSQALQLEGKLKTESHDYYFQAKAFGYIPNNDFPPLYLESINDQALFDIGKAKQKINQADFIEAEKILISILQLPDTLNPKIRGNTYYLLGDIAIELNDCEYARQYYSRSNDYSVTDNVAYNFQTAREKVMNCMQVNQNIQSPDFVEIATPEGDIPETRKSININIISETHYPYNLSVRNINEGIYEKTKLGDTLSINQDRIYYLNYHPLREQIVNLSFTISFIITILTIIV